MVSDVGNGGVEEVSPLREAAKPFERELLTELSYMYV